MSKPEVVKLYFPELKLSIIPYLIKDIERAECTQRNFTKQLCKRLNMKYNNYFDTLCLLSLENLEIRRLEFDRLLVLKFQTIY